MSEKRILSGMRPSGPMHLGSLAGALTNWRKFQGRTSFYMIADWHALTTDYRHGEKIKQNIRTMVVDWLSAGLSSKESTIFLQSHVPEQAQLHLILSMITPLSWLLRNPSFKEHRSEIHRDENNTFGFLGYPVLQAADILAYKATVVPVGADQLPHLEISREIARRFNHFYGPLFPIPEPSLTEVPQLSGTDGRKMSYNYNNCIYLCDPPEEVNKKILNMNHDPMRLSFEHPGHTNLCPVYSLHKVYSFPLLKKIKADCESARLACPDCKKILAERLWSSLDILYQNRAKYQKDPALIDDILNEGARRARAVAQETLEEVRQAIKL